METTHKILKGTSKEVEEKISKLKKTYKVIVLGFDSLLLGNTILYTVIVELFDKPTT